MKNYKNLENLAIHEQIFESILCIETTMEFLSFASYSSIFQIFFFIINSVSLFTSLNQKWNIEENAKMILANLANEN